MGEGISRAPFIKALARILPRGPKPSARSDPQRRAEWHKLRIGTRESLFTSHSPPIAPSIRMKGISVSGYQDTLITARPQAVSAE
jgi:hypothetical protein